MNWKIVFQLSAFGMIMAIATISLIPEKVEPVFWLVIFGFCAYVIAKVCPGKYFLHGFFTSVVNAIWVTAAHIFFRETYIAHHPQVNAMGVGMPHYLAVHPRLSMALMGPVFGILFGIILGLFSVIASKIVKSDKSV